jgi:hypothetical protein
MTRELFTDVDMDHPWVSQYRLPVIEYSSPRFTYVVTVTVPSKELEESRFYMLTSPTEEEAKVLASFLEYTKSEMGNSPRFMEEMAKLPLDLDGTWNTISIMKRKDGTWAYQRNSWTQGPSPQVGWDKQCRSVVEILDYIENDCMTSLPRDKWTAWKQEHGIS